MPASQSGFGNFFLERSVGMPTGYHLPVLGCPPGVQQQQQQQQQVQHLAAMAAGVPITYSGLPGYSFIPYPQHRPVTHMNPGFDLKASPPYHHALLARAGAFYPPYRAGAADDPGRVAKVATRESTGALKAWLNEHLKNPYPTKGEKIMLAIITKMSLTQVSTWFANARRRLKKENRVSWASKGGKSDEEDEEHEGGSDEEERGPLRECPLEDRDEVEQQGEDRVERVEDGAAPAEARLEAQPSGARDDAELGLREAERSDSDHEAAALGSKENSQKPKIWSLAETATSETSKKPSDNVYSPGGRLWAEWASRNGLLVPSCYTSHERV